MGAGSAHQAFSLGGTPARITARPSPALAGAASHRELRTAGGVPCHC